MTWSWYQPSWQSHWYPEHAQSGYRQPEAVANVDLQTLHQLMEQHIIISNRVLDLTKENQKLLKRLSKEHTMHDVRSQIGLGERRSSTTFSATNQRDSGTTVMEEADSPTSTPIFPSSENQQ